MLKSIQRIIAVINDFSMFDEVLAKTFSLAKNFDATVELLYVHESPFFDVPDLFRTDKDETLIDKEKIKEALLEKLYAYRTEIKAVVFVYIDDTENRVWAQAREEKEILIVTAYHKEISEKIITKVKQPVLVVKTALENYKKVALVIDAASDTNCIASVKNHFDKSEIELFYDHRYIVDTGLDSELESARIIEEAQREAFEALKTKNNLAGTFFIDGGFQESPMSEYGEKNNFDLFYVCARDDDFFISNSLAIRLLDTVPCDMLVSSL